MPVLKLDGDASGAVKATADVDAGLGKVAKTAKQLSIDSQQLRDDLEKAMNEQPIDRYIRKCDELAKKFVEGKISAGQYTEQTDALAQKLKRTGEEHGHAFGSHSVQQLVSYAAGLFTIHKAIEVVTEAMAEAREERKRAGENVAGGLIGFGELQNLSNSPEAYAHNVEVARRLMDEGVVARNNQAQASQAAAGMASAGITSADEDFLIRLGRDHRLAPGSIGSFATGIGGLQDAYGGTFEGRSKQVLAASAQSQGRLTPDQIALYAADISDQAVEGGYTFEQTLALIAAEARTSKSPKSAVKKAKDVISGEGDLSGPAAEAYARILQELQGAPGKDLPFYMGDDKRLGAAAGAEEAEGQRTKLIEEQLAEARLLTETAHKEIEARELAEGRGGFHRALGRIGRDMETYFAGDEAELRSIANQPDISGQLKPETLERIEEYLQRQTELMEQDTPAPHRGRGEE